MPQAQLAYSQALRRLHTGPTTSRAPASLPYRALQVSSQAMHTCQMGWCHCVVTGAHVVGWSLQSVSGHEEWTQALCVHQCIDSQTENGSMICNLTYP